MTTASLRSANTVASSQQYRDNVLAALARGSWGPEVESTAQRVAQRLARARQQAFTPQIGRALLAAARTLFFIAAPLLAAERLWDAGWGWAAAPLVILAGMGLYGGVAILHDLAHNSFLPSRQLNTTFGHLLAPFLLMEFSGFRRSHLDHHRLSQSADDPKRFGVEHRPETTTDPDHNSLDLAPALLRGPIRLGLATAALPLRVRHVLYLLVLPLFMGPSVLFFSGEFSVARRDWRRRESWPASLASLAFLAALYAWSPHLLILFGIALLAGHAFTFHVFAAHLSPHQVYWTTAHRATLADALNVSDIHCGSLVRWLGLGLSDYHSLHHLSPAIPCYHLPAAEAMVADEIAPLRAPSLDLLDPTACAILFDSALSGVGRKNADSWDYSGAGGVRRIVTPPSGP